jgi:hypothetical protein
MEIEMKFIEKSGCRCFKILPRCSYENDRDTIAIINQFITKDVLV